MTTPTLVASYSASGSGSATVNVPNVQVNDWLVACIGNGYDTTGAADDAPTGSGSGTWTAIGSALGSPNSPNYQNFNLHAWRKTATSAGTHTVTFTVPNEDVMGVLHLRNCLAIDGTPSGVVEAQGAADVNQTANATSPSTSDALLVGVFGSINFSGSLTYTPPTGMTERVDIQDGTNHCSLEIATQVLSASGTTGTRTAVASRTPSHGCAQKLFAISGAVTIRFGSPTAALTLSTSPSGKKIGKSTPSATAMTLSASPAGKKIGKSTPSATAMTLAASLVQGGKYKAATATASALTLAASVPAGFGRKVIPVSATAITLGATRSSNKIGMGAATASAVTLSTSAPTVFKRGIGRPNPILTLGTSLSGISRTGGLPVPVTRLPLPPLTQPLRLIAQEILTKKWLDWDLPVNDVEITYSLSGPTIIKGTFKPEIQSVRELGLDAWATYIHAEIDGQIRASGILMPVNWDEEAMQFEAMGISEMAYGTPYLGQLVQEIYVDPLNMVRLMWTHLQSYPEGNIGALVDNTLSGVKIGEPARLEVSKDQDGNPQTTETNTKDDIPGSKTNRTTVLQNQVSTTVWNNLLAYGYPTNQTPSGVLAIFPTEYDFNKAKGVPVKSGDSTTTTTTMQLIEAKPYTLAYWNLTDIGTEIDNLAKSTPFDWDESAVWNAGKTDVVHKIGLYYPRKGTRRFDLRFVVGENILDLVQVAEGADTYASEVIVIGAGEGKDAVRGYTGQRFEKRLRRVAFSNQKNITTQEAANALAQDELLSRRGRMLEFSQIVVDAEHPNAKLGEYQTGDDIFVQVDLPWVGDLGIWHRITGYTYQPDRDLVTLKLARSDSFRYGSTT